MQLVSLQKLQKLVGPDWRILKALVRSLGLALGQWEPLKNFTKQRDSDRGSDCEDGAGPAERQWGWGETHRDFRDVWEGGSAGLLDGLTGEGQRLWDDILVSVCGCWSQGRTLVVWGPRKSLTLSDEHSRLHTPPQTHTCFVVTCG